MISYFDRDIIIDLGKGDIEGWDRLYCYQINIICYADNKIPIPSNSNSNMWYRSDPYV